MAANGGDIEICGSLTLQWKWLNGNEVHEHTFLVLRMEELDVIIGVGNIVAMKLITLHKDAFLRPMIAHNKVTLGQSFSS